MKYLMIILAMLLANQVQAKPNCERHPIYCKIVKLKPSVNHTFAMELSNYIHMYSRRFGTNPDYSIAIAMQESSIVNRDRMGMVVTKEGKRVRGISDVGVFQIHVGTVYNLQNVNGWNIDFQRLRTDIKYQTYWHTRLLRRKIGVCKAKRKRLRVKEGNEWSCYHSYTYKRRQVYLSDVNVHLGSLSK